MSGHTLEYWQALELLDPASTCSSYATWNVVYVYFQAVKEHSPVKSGIDMLEISLTIAPIVIIPGMSVAIFNRSCIQNYINWVVSIVSFAVLSLINADTHNPRIAGLQLPAAVGVGILYVTIMFPVLAPLGVSKNAHALTSFIFVHTFSYTFGITISSTVMQNELEQRLPPLHRALPPTPGPRIRHHDPWPHRNGAPAHAAGVCSIDCGHMACAHGDRRHGAHVVSDHKGYPDVG
ncbi:hypothetical protein K439DRAFT_1626972 [Ramaria rubella]|nr:hypothetical protein K439DRAFT_1626972 [Ramaria rubella]